MQGETRVGMQGTPRSRGWLGKAIVAVALAAGLLSGVAQAQKGNSPPSVTLSASTSQIAANTTTVLTAVATDSDGSIARVVFYSGATQLSQVTTAPYRLNFTPAVMGTYAITAVAYDNLGASTTSNAVTITVLAGANMPPTVSLTVVGYA